MTTTDELYQDRHPFTPGPTDAIDHLILQGIDAIEITWRLTVPIWLVRQRFAHRAAQHDARTRDLQMSVK